MNRITFFWLFLLASVVYAIGLGVEIMGVDSAQYALISQEMNESGNYLQVQLRGNDYLDKPPLLFWVSSLMFNILGYSNWSFKLGSFLFTLLGVYSTFRLGKLLYKPSTGRLAAIILYTCQAFFLFNNDVRTDTILTGATIFSIWQIMEWLRRNRWKWLIGAAVGIAMAMMAKGPMGLMIPALAVASYLVGKQRWRDFLRWEYLVLLVMVAVLLSPMLWGLYEQFDKHPEKVVLMPGSEGMLRETGVSGLRFYLWTQSFGRITGESVWSDSSGPFFFVHNLLWSFLPWALMFIMAFFWQAVRIVRRGVQNKRLPELLTFGGFLLPFIAFSLSSFKLPHYIFVLFPLASILTAYWWTRVCKSASAKSWKVAAFTAQSLVLLASLGVLYLIYFSFFPGAPWYQPVVSLVIFVAAVFCLAGSFRQKSMVIYASVLISVSANYSLNAWFYPQLMQYQVGEEMVDKIESLGIDKEDVHHYHFYSFASSYYMGIPEIPTVNKEEIRQMLQTQGKVYLLTEDPHLEELQEGFDTEVLFRQGTHSVTRLNSKFLVAETRPEQLEYVYLVEVE